MRLLRFESRFQSGLVKKQFESVFALSADTVVRMDAAAAYNLREDQAVSVMSLIDLVQGVLRPFRVLSIIEDGVNSNAGIIHSIIDRVRKFCAYHSEVGAVHFLMHPGGDTEGRTLSN